MRKDMKEDPFADYIRQTGPERCKLGNIRYSRLLSGGRKYLYL